MGVDDVEDGWQASARAPVELADDDLTVIRRSESDPERFSVLVRRHGPAVGRYVSRRIGRERAEDVVAETFLVARFLQTLPTDPHAIQQRAIVDHAGQTPG